MPYIKQEFRKEYDIALNSIKEIKTKGDLEYCIYYLMKLYMVDKCVNYSNLHDTVYSAQHCADEFRRNYLDKREDFAKAENGDILVVRL
jgi:hypothetical protein